MTEPEATSPEEQPMLPMGPRVYIPPHARAKPVVIWGICKAAALEADWSLRRWDEFKRTSDACLKNRCGPEDADPDIEAFMKVVEERFSVAKPKEATNE